MCSKLSPITYWAWLLITEEASRLTCGCVELSFSASTILQCSQPEGSLTSYVKPASPNVCGYPSAAVWLNSSASFLQGDPRWSVGKAGVTRKQIHKWNQLECLPTALLEVPVGGAQGLGALRASPPSYPPVSVSLQRLKSSHWPRHTLIYAHACSYLAIIRRCKPLVNNCLFSSCRCWVRIRRRR